MELHYWRRKLIFGKSKTEKEILTQIKLAYAVLDNPKIKFAWLPVKINAIKRTHIDNGKWIWLEKYISCKDRFKITYHFSEYDEIICIIKIRLRSIFDHQKTYVVKYDKDFESDKFTLLGSDQTKPLLQDYIRKLEREFSND